MTDHADRYRRLAARFTRIVEAVPADAWANPSPCEGWTARDVLAHVAQTQADFLARQDLPADPGPTGPDAADPTTAEGWAEVRDRVQAVLDDPDAAGTTYDGYFGPTTVGETIDTFYTGDLLVHGWDLARAAGLADLEALPADDVAHALAGMSALPEEAVRSEGIYGPPVEVPADADPQTRFLAFTGRRP